MAGAAERRISVRLSGHGAVDRRNLLPGHAIHRLWRWHRGGPERFHRGPDALRLDDASRGSAWVLYKRPLVLRTPPPQAMAVLPRRARHGALGVVDARGPSADR